MSGFSSAAFNNPANAAARVVNPIYNPAAPIPQNMMQPSVDTSGINYTDYYKAHPIITPESLAAAPNANIRKAVANQTAINIPAYQPIPALAPAPKIEMNQQQLNDLIKNINAAASQGNVYTPPATPGYTQARLMGTGSPANQNVLPVIPPPMPKPIPQIGLTQARGKAPGSPVNQAPVSSNPLTKVPAVPKPGYTAARGKAK